MNNIKQQTGMALLEGLISMLLMMIVVLGLSFVSARATKAISYTKENIIVVNQLREILLNNNSQTLCARPNLLSISLPSGPKNVTVKNCNLTVGVTMELSGNVNPGKGINSLNAPIVLSVNVNGVIYQVGGKIIVVT